MDSSLSEFHPIIQRWFQSRFPTPTEPQNQGWPHIAAGEHTLIAAPTGSGKTLAAFLSVIDRLLKQAIDGQLQDETRVVYVSPLRALSNDMHRNLESPLREMIEFADAESPASGEAAAVPNIRVGLRTGDTTSSKRAALVRRPVHILVTTPESLYLMLTAEKSRQTLRTVETVIVDEIHALVRDKRGSHLALTLERLEAVCEKPLQRIGLSATQKPIERMARFLGGSRVEGPGSRASGESRESRAESRERTDSNRTLQSPTLNSQLSTLNCTVVDIGHGRELDLAIEVPPSELSAVCMHEQWAEVNARIVELINQHRSTLIFVNTRRLAERVTHQLTELLGEDAVGSHHGSLSADIRLKTERQLKSGELKAVVATASLELGIDIGYIDLVIQIGSPRSIATFLQRIGRSGHSLSVIPKGRLFALTRDELFECMALIRAVHAGRLDAVPIPEAPLDVLAQQIVAEVSAQEWGTDQLFSLFRRADPYRSLSREQFDRTVDFLSEGISQMSGRSRVYLHHDQVGRRLRARKGARIAAICNGGAIPEIASFRVVAEPEHTVVGTLDEDFAMESQAGDIFLLGNTSWRIQYVRGGDVTVTDAQGAPPTIPFWFGEAPGRTLELSEEVSRLREELDTRLADSSDGTLAESHTERSWIHKNSAGFDLNSCESSYEEITASECGRNELLQWLVNETGCSEFAAQQAIDYAAAQKAAIGLLPTQRRIVFERFFDESGGMQLVVHAPFGSRINRAWGLAMRKRFCRSFDFELQATADDDGFILSLGPQHSFPLESMFSMLSDRNVGQLLEQALLAIPMFQLRWRWNVTRALLVLRQRNGKKVPPAFQRFRADDLLTAVFPKLTGCQENVTGDIELPDQPLVTQTMHDCLHEALDLDGLRRTLSGIERGEISLIARDTREPSPFCYELLNAYPYAFLDGGEIQERRTRAVSVRRTLTVESVRDLGRLDPEAIDQVRREARPLVRNADELHDVLLSRIILPVPETQDFDSMSLTHGTADAGSYFQDLSQQNRAATIQLPGGLLAWVAAERLPAANAAFPEAKVDPSLKVPNGIRQDWASTESRVAIVRGLMEICGPITGLQIAERIGITPSQAFAALEALEGEGVVLRGQFTPDTCDTDGDTNAQSKIENQESQIEKIEWCHRRLLARIHRLTLEGLRRQIEPVDVAMFIRFLTRHHGVLPDRQNAGANGVFQVVAMLQGLDIPVICWERDVLPVRIEKYRPEWLDELCLAGEVGWGRLIPSKRDPDRSKPMASLTRVAPVSLFVRSDIKWLTQNTPQREVDSLSSVAAQVFDLLRKHGASFASDLMTETRMLPPQLDDALGELVTRGLVTADGFSGLRRLISEKGNSSSRTSRRRRGVVRTRNARSGTGRWSVWIQPATDEDKRTDEDAPGAENVEQWAWQLLRRWGVVFRDLLVRESGAPRWFELLQVYRRLEARGEVRGGRFISGVAGEQFALGDTVKQLRNLRDEELRRELVVLSAADPLNLIGILTDHARVPSTAVNRVAYLDGAPAACLQAGELHLFRDLPNEVSSILPERFGLAGTAMPKTATASPTDSSADDESDRKDDSDASHQEDGNGERKQRRQPRSPRGIPRPMIS